MKGKEQELSEAASSANEGTLTARRWSSCRYSTRLIERQGKEDEVEWSGVGQEKMDPKGAEDDRRRGGDEECEA